MIIGVAGELTKYNTFTCFGLVRKGSGVGAKNR
jgi:hypothetical protein